MARNVRYFYLKLKESFFDSEEIKILEGMPNGESYVLLYLKLSLLSLKDSGRLCFKDRIPYSIEMLTTIFRMNIDIVRAGMIALEKIGLIDVLTSGEMYISDIQSLIGRSSSEAERLFHYRKRIAHLKITGTNEVQMYPHIKLETDLDLELEGKDPLDSKKTIREMIDNPDEELPD